MEKSVQGVSALDCETIALTIRKPLMAGGDGDSELCPDAAVMLQSSGGHKARQGLTKTFIP